MGKANGAAAIYPVLRDEIISLKVRPGDMLGENPLAERFGVSRTVIRSVLQRLQENGFVRIIPHVGTQVTAIDLDEVNTFIYLRVAVESTVLRDFLHICTPFQLEEMRSHLSALEQMAARLPNLTALTEDYTSDCLREDLSFHECYFRATNHQMLWDRLTAPQPGYSRFIQLDMLEGKNLPEVLTEHRELMRIVDESAADRVESCLSHHLNGGVRRLGSKLFADERYTRYFTGAAVLPAPAQQ